MKSQVGVNKLEKQVKDMKESDMAKLQQVLSTSLSLSLSLVCVCPATLASVISPF
jgi:hypothetical protein